LILSLLGKDDSTKGHVARDGGGGFKNWVVAEEGEGAKRDEGIASDGGPWITRKAQIRGVCIAGGGENHMGRKYDCTQI